LDAAFVKLAAIRERLEDSNEYPPCCLTFHEHSRISCDVLGPMPEKVFLQHCEICRRTMMLLLNRINESLQLNPVAEERERKRVA
jgi:hypothetical protein